MHNIAFSPKFTGLPIERMPTDVLLDVLPGHSPLRAALQPPAPSGITIHTGDDMGAQAYVGTAGVDTLVVDYLLPLNTGVVWQFALDSSVAGTAFEIEGSQLNRSTLSGIENLTLNVDGARDTYLYGDNGDNVLTLNMAADSSGVRTVLGKGGDDTIVLNNLSNIRFADLGGSGGNDVIFANGWANILDVDALGQPSGDDQYVLGSGRQFINFYGGDVGHDSVSGFTPGEDLILFFGFGTAHPATVERHGQTTTFTTYDDAGNALGSVTVDAALVAGVDYFII